MIQSDPPRFTDTMQNSSGLPHAENRPKAIRITGHVQLMSAGKPTYREHPIFWPRSAIDG
jgi:hypothetical protein